METTSAGDPIEQKRTKQLRLSIHWHTPTTIVNIVNRQSVEGERQSHVVDCYYFCKARWKHGLYTHGIMVQSKTSNTVEGVLKVMHIIVSRL